ncbi:very short patch repair endonuclease [Pseudomonadota bacterium]
MVDIVDTKTRSRMMSGIRGQDTRPEMVIRKGLQQLGFRHRLGNRYRLEGKLLPGRPDLVFPRFRAVIQVNGCFWHRHECHLFRWPGTRQQFWRDKLEGNFQRDLLNQRELESMGWRVLVIWECAIKGATNDEITILLNTAANWVQFDVQSAVIEGGAAPQ